MFSAAIQDVSNAACVMCQQAPGVRGDASSSAAQQAASQPAAGSATPLPGGGAVSCSISCCWRGPQPSNSSCCWWWQRRACRRPADSRAEVWSSQTDTLAGSRFFLLIIVPPAIPTCSVQVVLSALLWLHSCHYALDSKDAMQEWPCSVQTFSAAAASWQPCMHVPAPGCLAQAPGVSGDAAGGAAQQAAAAGGPIHSCMRDAPQGQRGCSSRAGAEP
jgi:hypothetical protein